MTFDAPCGPLGSSESAGRGSGFRDFTRTNTTRAHAHALRRLSHNDSHLLKVWIPAPFGPVIGVADSVAVHRALLTYFATCHEADLLS